MADPKLFRIDRSQVEELSPTPVQLEKQLQTLIEGNLETLLGIRFVKTEHSTGQAHGGRIDSLGLDENSSPVIIEYKRRKSENVINQGLFYLDWLMDHKAEFKFLVGEALGSEAMDAIDWSEPRVICIAQSFTKYDEHAVKQMSRNIELIRYRRYGDEFILLELVNTSSAKAVAGGATGGDSKDKTSTDKPIDLLIEEVSGTNLGLLYAELRERILSLGDDVQEKHLKSYVAFKRIRNFASVFIRKKQLELVLYVKVDPATVNLEDGFTRDVSMLGHFGTQNLEIRIDSDAKFERAWPMIEQSYERA